MPSDACYFHTFYLKTETVFTVSPLGDPDNSAEQESNRNDLKNIYKIFARLDVLVELFSMQTRYLEK